MARRERWLQWLTCSGWSPSPRRYLPRARLPSRNHGSSGTERTIAAAADAGQLRQRRARLGDVLEHLQAEDEVEAVVLERQVRRCCGGRRPPRGGGPASTRPHPGRGRPRPFAPAPGRRAGREPRPSPQPASRRDVGLGRGRRPPRSRGKGGRSDARRSGSRSEFPQIAARHRGSLAGYARAGEGRNIEGLATEAKTSAETDPTGAVQRSSQALVRGLLRGADDGPGGRLEGDLRWRQRPDLRPTGSGKTLASFLWGIDKLAALSPSSAPASELVYVSPLKALSYDIERNLRAPLRGIGAEISVGLRTGDTSQAERRKMRKRRRTSSSPPPSRST